jgi:hypothetical protein
MPRLAGVLLVVLALAACSTQSLQTPAYAPPAVVAPPAPASIVGHGAFRRESGGHVTCAGFSVALVADSPSSTRRIEALYGPPAARLMEPVAEVKARSAKLPPSTDAIEPAATSTCDVHGAFGFPSVPSGGYFLIAHVKQKPAQSGVEDYVILERVFLEPGEAADISLAP